MDVCFVLALVDGVLLGWFGSEVGFGLGVGGGCLGWSILVPLFWVSIFPECALISSKTVLFGLRGGLCFG